MGYITLKQAAELWNISERRIRRLIQENRIDGAVKIGNAWSIPEETSKPMDKRYKMEEDRFIIDVPSDFFKELDEKKQKLDSKRPLPKETLKSLGWNLTSSKNDVYSFKREDESLTLTIESENPLVVLFTLKPYGK